MTEQDWHTTLTTRSGLEFEVRPVQVGDATALSAFFEAVSKEDLRFRFLSAVQHVDQSQIDAMTQVDHRQTEDFVALEPGTHRIIANAMLAADDKLDTAEVAISIRNDLKGRGIGWTLLDYVTRYARARGIRTLQSIESRANHQAIELEREMGFVAKPLEDDPTLVLLEAKLQQD